MHASCAVGWGAERVAFSLHAAIIYGGPRLTNDIDVVASLTSADLLRVAATFDEAGFYVPQRDIPPFSG